MATVYEKTAAPYVHGTSAHKLVRDERFELIDFTGAKYAQDASHPVPQIGEQEVVPNSLFWGMLGIVVTFYASLFLVATIADALV